MDADLPKPGRVTAKALYDRMVFKRRPYLDRAWDCAEVTIPGLLPRQGTTGRDDLPKPFQSVGARGVNNLAAKMLLALLPPNTPFLKLVLDQDARAQFEALDQGAGTEGVTPSQIDEKLAEVERKVQTKLETLAIRGKAHESFKHAIVTGNVACFLDKQGMRVFHLDKYVVERDPNGTILTLIVKEQVAMASLPPEVRALARNDLNQASAKPDVEQTGEFNTGSIGQERPVELYTVVTLLEGGDYRVYQEVGGVELDGAGTYKADRLPWFVLRFNHIDGEDYGRGHVEEYLGDLHSLEGLSQAIVEGSAMGARVVFLRKPNASVRAADITGAANGAVIDGDPEDVKALMVEKAMDLNIAAQTAKEIKDQLSFAFLLNTAVQRNGERVTAEEIRYMAGELEDTLGGVYSLFSQEFQLPLARVILAMLEDEKAMPPLPKEVKPTIVTGMEALGRGHELMRLQTAIAMCQQLLGPENTFKVLIANEAARQIFVAAGVAQKGLIKTDEQMASEAQAAAQQAQMQALGPQVVKSAGDFVNQQAAQAAQPQQQQQ